jgi:hypothetical protein
VSPVRVGSRAVEYAPLTDELRAQLERVTPSVDGGFEYRPCRVRLASGEVRDFVYVVEADSYIRAWGVWPGEDDAKDEVSMADVAAVEESPHRLPADLANKLYEWGESGMGYTVFTVVLRDGRRLPRVTGNAVDFPALPDGVTTSDIADVLREGRDAFRHRAPGADEGTAPYAWCLYRTA